MGPSVRDVAFAFGVVEEYLGWLPCFLHLRVVHRSALHIETLARLQRTFQRVLYYLPSPHLDLSLRDILERLWGAVVCPLLNCRRQASPGGSGLVHCNVDIIVRHQPSSMRWWPPRGDSLLRRDLGNVLFKLCCSRAWVILENYGEAFWYHEDDDGAGGSQRRELHAVVAGGFEVLFCRTIGPAS